MPANSKLIAFVGRLHPLKNVHRLFTVLGRLTKMMAQPVYAVIAGSAEPFTTFDWYDINGWREEMATQIAAAGLTSRVLMLGHVRNDVHLSEVYARSDVAFVPSNMLDENFGLAAVEAMACGTPVVACNWGGLGETIVHGYTGSLLPTWVTRGGLRFSDSHAATALQRWLAEGREGSSAVSRARALNYSLEALSTRLLRVLRSLIERERPNTPVRKPWGEGETISGGRFRGFSSSKMTVEWDRLRRHLRYYTDDIVATGSQGLESAGPWAPVEQRPGLYELVDRAWPARYLFEPKLAALLDRGGLTARELRSHGFAVEELLADGVLVGY